MKKRAKVPRDEMVLARLIQVTKARGLVACRGETYRDSRGNRLPSDKGAVACCALGAADLARLSIIGTGIVAGNDGRDYVTVFDDTRLSVIDRSGYDIGRSFYDACKR